MMEEKIYAYKCAKCGQLHHPKHYVCRKCGCTDFEEIPLEGEGTVVTWTRVYNLPEGYMKPYLGFAIVKFDNGPVVSGQFEAEEMKSGMRVKPTVGVIKEGVGRDYYGFVFKPVEA
jgi:uncharacterized OB-fold protein